MPTTQKNSYALPSIALLLGLVMLGYFINQAILDHKLLDRSVTVKGLSEKEFLADVVIWPIQFTAASNDVEELYSVLESNTDRIRTFLTSKGFTASEITIASPAITDKSAQQYGNNVGAEYRYTATQTVTVYSDQIEKARDVMSSLSELGKQGIVLTSGDYLAQTEYLFTRLNEIKPDMIEEATRNAREVAEKFAADSQSRLGKIKRASQGQFSIRPRDKNNPHIQLVRVVSTIEYYLSD